MAKQTLNNGETGLVHRTKLNENFTELYDDKVPYTGATQDVDLDTYKLNAQSIHAKGTGGAGHLGLKHQSADITASTSESSLGANSAGNPVWKNDGNPLQEIAFSEDIITDHGGLGGLADDDHTQYHNDARGDARYSQLGHTHTKGEVGLGNVDNTSDVNKPVSTAQQSALDTKQNILLEGAFVNGDKTKLNSIEAGAEVNNISDDNALELTDGGATTLHKHSYNDLDDKPTIPTQYTDEMAQDAVGTILVDSTEIDFVYDDATPSITASLKNGSIDETKLDTSVNASLDLADSAVQPTNTVTLTNKRITKRVVTVTQSATPTYNTDNGDVFKITGLAQAITSMTSGLTGTPVEGDMIKFEITDDGTARAITWGASFEASTVSLPTTTVISTRLDVLFSWNATTSKWRCLASA